MTKQVLIIDNDIARKHAINLIMSGTNLTVTIEQTKRKRTTTQNAAIHKYFDLLATELNDAGLDMRKVLTKRPDIPWSGDTVKEHIWRPVQEAMALDASTARLNRDQVSMVYDVVARFLSAKFGVYVPFPNKS
tara:strand:+ start:276 stop:674 length:399 start_codon:yes stop_codon:yes gene_type:complete